MNHLFAPIKYLAIFPLFNRVQMHNQNQWEVNRTTFASYLEYLGDAFIIDRAERYDIKGKKYIDSPYKYYFTDNGLRNVRLNFRQIERSHLMENIIYNELI